MNAWTDILLIVAIVVGLISAASLPLVSVNAVSSDALRLHDGRRDAPPWLMLRDDAERRRLSAWNEASLARRSAPSAALPPTGTPAAAAGIGALGVVEALPAAILDPGPAASSPH
jgi:hypothetical protein